jgi:hypothetical protein
VRKRHRRIRAGRTTGQVAGRPPKSPGSNAHRPRTGLPNLRSPRKPLSRSADRRSRPGHQPPSDSFIPREAAAVVISLVATRSDPAPVRPPGDALVRRRASLDAGGQAVPDRRPCHGASQQPLDLSMDLSGGERTRSSLHHCIDCQLDGPIPAPTALSPLDVGRLLRRLHRRVHQPTHRSTRFRVRECSKEVHSRATRSMVFEPTPSGVVGYRFSRGAAAESDAGTVPLRHGASGRYQTSPSRQSQISSPDRSSGRSTGRT